MSSTEKKKDGVLRRNLGQVMHVQTKLKRYTTSKKYEQFSLNVKSKVKRLYLYTVMADSRFARRRVLNETVRIKGRLHIANWVQKAD